MPTRAPAKILRLRIPAADRQRFDQAAAREGLRLTEWLLAAAELAVARGAVR